MFNPILSGDGLDDTLPPELKAKAAALREAGPIDEDPVRSALERARIDKVAIADGTKKTLALDKLFGESSELDALRARLSKAAVDANLSPEAIQHRMLVDKFCGGEDEIPASATSSLAKGADPTWGQILAPASSNARLEAPQRHGRLKPEPAPGEPEQHADGDVVQKWPGGLQSWSYKDGKIIRTKTEFTGNDGTTVVEYFAGDGDEIDEDEYNRLAA